MNEPRRLRDGSSSELTRALLRAGAEEQPSSAAIARAAAAATAVTAVTAATTAATAGTTAKIAAASTLAKWTAVVVFGVTAASGGAYVYARAQSPAQPAPAISAPSVASSAPAQRSPDSPTIIAVPNVETPPSASAAPSSPKAPAPRPSASNLRAQLDDLEHITQLLESGDANKTLAALDRFDHDFPGHSLGQETMRLRIEALLKKGDRAAARELAKKFLARHPASPYAARVRSLLRDSTNP
jgi:hypothetical protein